MENPLSYSELEAVWIAGGGPESSAPVAAAIALAESSGIYEWIGSTEALSTLVAQGASYYYSPVPGVFAKATGQETPGTPAYYRIS